MIAKEMSRHECSNVIFDDIQAMPRSMAIIIAHLRAYALMRVKWTGARVDAAAGVVARQ